MPVLEINAKFMHPYLPSPRHRKLRYEAVKTLVTLELKETTSHSAPVAFIVKGNRIRLESEDFAPSVEEYRAYNGDLWVPSWKNDYVNQGKGPFTVEDLIHHLESRLRCGRTPEKEQLLADAQELIDRFLLIDGVVHERIGEPMFVIMTFGLGHNHGGTALMLSNWYNPNLRKDAYFTALQRDEAIAEAKRIAERRGDTDSISSVEVDKDITVLMPEMVRRNPALEHGDGDPFLNELHALSEAAPDAVTSGALVVAATLKEIGR